MVRTNRYAYFTSIAFNSLPFLIPSARIAITPISSFHILLRVRPIYAMTWNNLYCCKSTSFSTTAEFSTIPQHQQHVPLINGASIPTITTSINDESTPEPIPVVATSSWTTGAADPSTAATVPAKTFYRRSLPDTCIAFSSKLGRKYFESAMRHRGLKSYFHLMEQYTTQSEPAYCGISTLVIALNALAVDPRQIWKGSWRWYEESMLNCCIDLEQAKQTGITMSVRSCSLHLLYRIAV
jgi:Phytochelatin synthase